MSQTEPTNQPTSVIHSIYRESVEARANYIRLRTSSGSDSVERHAHQRLHQAVVGYFEVLKHQLRTKNSISEYWDGEPPTNGPPSEGTAYLWSEGIELVLSEDEVQAILEQPDPELTIQDYEQQPDGSYRIIAQQHTWGLKHIDEIWHERQVSTSRSVGFGGVSVSEESEPTLLPPKVLMRVATALDEAADQLNLLSEVEETSLPHETL